MPTYLTRCKWTDSGAKECMGSVERADAARAAMEAAGTRVIATYWLQGEDDIVIITETDNEELSAKFHWIVTSMGHQRVRTERAFGIDEMRQILGAAGAGSGAEPSSHTEG